MATTDKKPGAERAPLIDAKAFRERVVAAYNRGNADQDLPADLEVARSLIPPGTAALRDFSYLAPDMPRLIPDVCVGCMDCVTQCPDTAIVAKVVPESVLGERLAREEDPERRARLQGSFMKTTKYHDRVARTGVEGGLFGLFVDPTKCKGCAECVEVCGSHAALEMVPKNPQVLADAQRDFDFYTSLPFTPKPYINEKALSDMMLESQSLLYVGGAGSCMGCGEATALRMLLAATGFVYGAEGVGLVCATGCNTVYGSTYPYNPYLVPWTNPLFENAPAVAMGVRLRWDQQGLQGKKLWAVGGDGAMFDIGFQSLSRMLMSGMDINVLVLDTQVYSNTGGQTSMASFVGQEAKMSVVGRAAGGKREKRKELGLISLMHQDVFVAQVIASNPNHFYKAVMAANDYPGPSVVIVYAACQPEHGIGDDMAARQAKLACDTRAFPIFIYDPRKGNTIRERLDLVGNPSRNQDWHTVPKTGETLTFVDFARTEGRFAKHFDRDGAPSEVLQEASQERLDNWRTLQELAGIR